MCATLNGQVIIECDDIEIGADKPTRSGSVGQICDRTKRRKGAMAARHFLFTLAVARFAAAAHVPDPMPRVKPEGAGFASAQLARIGAVPNEDIEKGRIRWINQISKVKEKRFFTLTTARSLLLLLPRNTIRGTTPNGGVLAGRELLTNSFCSHRCLLLS
jgi:hypothetical protein